MNCPVRKNASGYLEIYTQGGWRLLHRVAAENMLGRPVQAGHHIHHKDGNKYNNRHENLQELSAKAHRALHARRRKVRK